MKKKFGIDSHETVHYYKIIEAETAEEARKIFLELDDVGEEIEGDGFHIDSVEESPDLLADMKEV